MHTRYTFYMALFSLIIFGWAFGIVALVLYVQRSTGAKQSHASTTVKLPTEIPSPTLAVPSTTPTIFFSPTSKEEPGYLEHSKFGQILSPTP